MLAPPLGAAGILPFLPSDTHTDPMVRTSRYPGAAALPRILVAAGMTAYVLAVYVVIVVGGAAVLGSGPANVPLAVVATGIVAMSLEPVGRFLRRRIARTDQDLLAPFQDNLAAAVAVDQVAPRMAELVAAATGAARVEVWVVLPEEPSRDELAARWPIDAEPIDSTRVGVRSDDVRHAGELIGRLLRDRGEVGANSPVEDRLVAALVAQAGVALRTVVLTNQLQQRVSESTARAAELRASRQRIVAAADLARHRLERDVHDGAQQHLVGLAVNLSLAATVSIRDPARAAGLLKDLKPAAANALTTLDELSLGIYPRLLAGSGIAAALRSAVATSTVPVSVQVGNGSRRYEAIFHRGRGSCLLHLPRGCAERGQARRRPCRPGSVGLRRRSARPVDPGRRVGL